jgi:hypothetical protein
LPGETPRTPPFCRKVRRAAACLAYPPIGKEELLELGRDIKARGPSFNVHRRHLTPGQKRERIEALIKASPERSDRAIAKAAGVHNETVAAARKRVEARDGIRHVSKRKDAKGRQQPAAKPPKPAPAKPAPAKPADTRGDIGPQSAGELQRLTVRLEEVSREKRVLESRCTGLASEVEELKAAAQQQPAKVLAKSQDENEATIAEVMKAALRHPPALSVQLHVAALEGQLFSIAYKRRPAALEHLWNYLHHVPFRDVLLTGLIKRWRRGGVLDAEPKQKRGRPRKEVAAEAVEAMS